ncbi:MAG: tRNA dihydrouridine synthase DusB [Clostridia bacterium]
MIIQGKEIKGLFLAPMAGITDAPFRTVCVEHGAALTYSEMISAKGLLYDDKKTKKLLSKTNPSEPFAIQIFGSEIEPMKYAAQYVSSLNPVLIDINMGCPVAKIVKNLEGSALMKDIKKAYQITKAVVEASNVPVSVKFRSGFDKQNLNYIDFGKAMEEAGAACITLHPRTRDMFYSGKADWSHIIELKENVNIPVIANGDVICEQDIEDIRNQTGCYDVMIGRGSLGNPWIFSNTIPSTEQRVNVFKYHMDLQINYNGEKKGIMEMRKHGAWYFKGLHNSAKLRDLIFKAVTRNDVIRCIEMILNTENS